MPDASGDSPGSATKGGSGRSSDGNKGDNGKNDSNKGSGGSGKSEDAEKVPVEPQPLDDTPDGGKKTMTLVSVDPDSAVVRVAGERETLYLSVPAAFGVTYVSPLPGGCAWLAMAGPNERLMLCKGESVGL
jgi:hypothetical protein